MGKAATITSKGQVTIPRDIRSAMHLSKGDRIRFEADKEGYRIVKDSQAGSSAGILSDFVPKRKQPVTVEEMKEAAKDAVAGRFRKSSKR